MSKIFMGVRLRSLRQERGMTQVALAQALGISPSYLNQLEQDQRPFTVSVLLLHEALDTSLLIGGTLAVLGTAIMQRGRR